MMNFISFHSPSLHIVYDELVYFLSTIARFLTGFELFFFFVYMSGLYADTWKRMVIPPIMAVLRITLDGLET